MQGTAGGVAGATTCGRQKVFFGTPEERGRTCVRPGAGTGWCRVSAPPPETPEGFGQQFFAGTLGRGDERRSIGQGPRGGRPGGRRGRPASHPPEQVGGRDGPQAPVVRDVIAEAGGVPMHAVVPADGFHGRGVDPDEPGYLQDHALDAGHPVDHPVSGRHPAMRERMDRGPEALQPVQDGVLGIPPLQREVVVGGLRRIRHGLLQLVAKDGFADRDLEGRQERPAWAGAPRALDACVSDASPPGWAGCVRDTGEPPAERRHERAGRPGRPAEVVTVSCYAP